MIEMNQWVKPGRWLARGTSLIDLMVGVAVASFLALALVGVPFPVVVLGAGLLGLVGAQRWPQVFALA